MPTKTLHAWDSKSWLRNLNEIIEKLSILDKAGVTVPLWLAKHVRDEMLAVLVQDVDAETIEAPAMAEAAE